MNSVSRGSLKVGSSEACLEERSWRSLYGLVDERIGQCFVTPDFQSCTYQSE